jgi:hypothetical protein
MTELEEVRTTREGSPWLIRRVLAQGIADDCGTDDERSHPPLEEAKGGFDDSAKVRS